METFSTNMAKSICSGIRAMVRRNYPGVKLSITRTSDPDCGEHIDLWLKDAPFALAREGVNGDPGDYFDLMSEPAKELMHTLLAYVRRRAAYPHVISVGWYVGVGPYRW